MKDFSREEAAEELGISVRMLHNLRASGRIGYFRHGGRITFSEAHLNEYREHIEVKPERLTSSERRKTA